MFFIPRGLEGETRSTRYLSKVARANDKESSISSDEHDRTQLRGSPAKNNYF